MTLAEIAENLSSSDSEQRRVATIALAQAGDAPERLVPLLLQSLADENWRVREEAVRVVGHLSHKISLYGELLAALQQGDNVGLRNAAIASFGVIGVRCLGFLEDGLRTSEQGVRKFIIEALAVAGRRQAAPLLVTILESPDPNLVAAAIDALAVVGGPEAETALRGRLQCADPFQRMAAVDALNRLDARLPWSELAALSGDRLVWRVVVPAMGRSGAVEAVEPLLRALGERSARLLADLIAALGRLCSDVPQVLERVETHMQSTELDLRERIAAFFDNGDLRVRQGACALLLGAREVAVVDGLLGLVRDEHLAEVLLDMAARWGRELVELLLDRQARIGSPDRGLALWLAAQLAERLGTRQSDQPTGRLLTELRRALHGDELELRLAAVRSMGPFAGAQDAATLVQLAIGADWDMADACGPVLTQLSLREPDALRAALEQVDLNLCELDLIAELVARLDRGRAFDRLHGALLAEDPGVRCAALAGLGILGGEGAARLIGTALEDQSLVVQLRAAAALGSVCDDEGGHNGTEYLLAALQRDDADVRAAAALSLGEIGGGQAIEALRYRLDNDVSVVQVAAIRALRRLHAPSIQDVLVRVLGNDDTEVVKHALEALHGVDPKLARPHVEAAMCHERWDVRQLSASLLGLYVDELALATLRRALVTELDDLVRTAIEESLLAIRKAT